MGWITASNDPGFYVGPNTNMTGSIITSTTASFFYWKSLIKTAGWQICASWNGSSGAYYQDILTTVGSFGTNNAWFLASMPGSSRSILISNQGGDSWRAKYSYTGFTLTGSLSSVVPGPKIITSQSTNLIYSDGNAQLINGQICFLGDGSDASPQVTSNPFGLFNINTVVQMAAQNTAPYMFYMVHYNVLSTDRCSGAFFLDAMESGTYSTALPDPYLIYARANGSVSAKALDLDSLNNGGGGGSVSNGWGLQNNLSASWTQNVYSQMCYSFQSQNPSNGNLSNGYGVTIPGNNNGTGYMMSGTNFCVYDGQPEIFPAMCYAKNSNATRFSSNAGVSETGYRGISNLFRWKNPGAVKLGSTLSVVSGAKNWIAFGDTAFPWFGLPVTGAQTGIDYLAKEASKTTQYQTGSTDWFAGTSLWAVDDINFMTTVVQGGSSTGSILYRGTLGGQYVYNVGTPPAGASNIVIIKIG